MARKIFNPGNPPELSTSRLTVTPRYPPDVPPLRLMTNEPKIASIGRVRHRGETLTLCCSGLKPLCASGANRARPNVFITPELAKPSKRA